MVVRQDTHGRYSLNDLHRAAGLEDRHQPAYFLRNDGVRALIEEVQSANLQTAPVEAVNGGPNRGTYACRTVALRYAAWISAPFEFKVYKVLEDYLDGRLVPATPALPSGYIDALEALVVAEKEKLRLSEVATQQAQQLEAQGRVIEEQRPAMEFLERFVKAKGSAGVRRVAKGINRRQNDLVRDLLRDRVLYYEGRHLVPFAKYQDKGYFVVKLGEKNGHAFTHARFTSAGVQWAAARYGREAPCESAARLLPAAPQPAAQLPLLPESTQP
ncbi:KilA-N domain-containing protein [Myxococcus sp. CA040A]|uniref:KilA-N domain-containing protein n=1 Tax=Myxococcus sp. CA040A TaxID=2741738 RepID=UPI001C2DC7BA|nr:phage antirepressor KilAC domain-containing protein [Myxococcus sp. CA040A]